MISGVYSQNSSAVGIEDGDYWEFEVLAGTYEYTSDDTIETGETYEYRITSDPDSFGNYEFQIRADTNAVGEGSLAEFGTDVVYTDWNYWEDNADSEMDAYFETDGNTTIDNGVDVFKVTWSVSLISLTVEVDYYKQTGVYKSLKLEIEDAIDLEVQNITGAEAEKVSSSGLVLTIASIVILATIINRHKR